MPRVASQARTLVRDAADGGLEKGFAGGRAAAYALKGTGADLNQSDLGLRVMREIMGLEDLHFGLWEDGEELTVENCRRAQERYAERFISMIPPGVRRVLDVGCGTGRNAERLLAKGYEVEALSPDPYQEKVFDEKLGGRARFHLSRFEDFRAREDFDLLLFSESAEYMEKDAFFPCCIRALRRPGWVLVCDFFRKAETDRYGSCFLEEDFLGRAHEAGFEVVEKEDVTEATVPTVELARKMHLRYGIPAARLLADLARQKAPLLSRLAALFVRRKLRKLSDYIFEYLPLQLDPDGYRERVKYVFFLLRRASA